MLCTAIACAPHLYVRRDVRFRAWQLLRLASLGGPPYGRTFFLSFWVHIFNGVPLFLPLMCLASLGPHSSLCFLNDISSPFYEITLSGRTSSDNQMNGHHLICCLRAISMESGGWRHGCGSCTPPVVTSSAPASSMALGTMVCHFF